MAGSTDFLETIPIVLEILLLLLAIVPIGESICMWLTFGRFFA
jgi:hypothetical protein